jgi:hypothetical protein
MALDLFLCKIPLSQVECWQKYLLYSAMGSRFPLLVHRLLLPELRRQQIESWAGL